MSDPTSFGWRCRIRTPRRSAASWTGARRTSSGAAWARFRWSIEETAPRLLEVSEKAQEKRRFGGLSLRQLHSTKRRRLSCRAMVPAGKGIEPVTRLPELDH
jgi:hypothetical protein